MSDKWPSGEAQPFLLSFSNGTIFWQEVAVETLDASTADTEQSMCRLPPWSVFSLTPCGCLCCLLSVKMLWEQGLKLPESRRCLVLTRLLLWTVQQRWSMANMAMIITTLCSSSVSSNCFPILQRRHANTDHVTGFTGDVGANTLQSTHTHTCMYIQCIRKVFTALHFFHILLCNSLIPKWIKFIIFLNILHTTTHKDKVKTDFCKFLQIC